MRLGTLYGLVGLTWGLLLGALAAWQVIGAAAGFSWLYLLGDDPWPESAGHVILGLGPATFLAVLALCTALGVRFGRSATSTAPVAAAANKRRGYRLLALGWLVIAALVTVFGARVWERDNERRALASRTAWFERLLAERQTLASVATAPVPAETAFRLRIETRGARGGAYRAAWSVRSTAYGAALAEGGAALRLSPGPNVETLAIDAFDLIGRYHEVALNNRDADVEVAESFRLEVSLRPVLDEEELARLPRHEAQNLALGRSRLIDVQSVAFPAHFQINGPEYRVLE